MNKLSALLLGFTIFPSVVFAADDAHGEASKGGLPQFEPTWYASQIFWLAISFAVLYFIFAKKTLPSISSTIENRKNHIQSDLEMAEKLTKEADDVHDAYQQNLSSAQSDAADAVKKVESEAKQRAEEAMDAFRAKSDTALQEAEARIEASSITAMADMNDIAVQTAAKAVEKIIGVSPDTAKVEAVLKNMDGKAKAA